jgi:hypothetical protein
MSDRERPGQYFGQVRDEPCPQDGHPVLYQYGNWRCVGYIYPGQTGTGCGWNTSRDKREKAPLSSGWTTLESCPECGGVIIYNGNYFCERFGAGCDWALPHPARKKADRELRLRLIGDHG